MNKLNEIYLADYVNRWHAKPLIPHQTNGQHVSGMLTLCLALHPNPSAELLKAIIMHDKHEYASADFPHNAKKKYPELRAIDKKAADDYRYWAGFDEIPLSEIDQLFLRYLDQLEPLYFVNYFANLVHKSVLADYEALDKTSLDLYDQLIEKGFAFNDF